MNAQISLYLYIYTVVTICTLKNFIQNENQKDFEVLFKQLSKA